MSAGQQCKAIRVYLAKADPELRWEALTSELQPIKWKEDAKASDARLALMRKALRAQRKPHNPLSATACAKQEPLQICC